MTARRLGYDGAQRTRTRAEAASDTIRTHGQVGFGEGVAVADQPERRRCAVIFNPTKVSEDFRTTINRQLVPTAWEEPIWLATTEDDPGHSMAARAVEAAVDLVIAAGGDGTVRIVANGLANSGIPMGVVAAGTGNLLAHSLDLPLKEAEAVEVALQMQGDRSDQTHGR